MPSHWSAACEASPTPILVSVRHHCPDLSHRSCNAVAEPVRTAAVRCASSATFLCRPRRSRLLEHDSNPLDKTAGASQSTTIQCLCCPQSLLSISIRFPLSSIFGCTAQSHRYRQAAYDCRASVIFNVDAKTDNASEREIHSSSKPIQFSTCSGFDSCKSP